MALETGFSRNLISRHARRLGILITPARRRARIDPFWLREQAQTLRRANGDIAAELGLTHETIRRYRSNYGIPGRPTGDSRHRRLPGLTEDVRRAVEGQRRGWLRLRRFQQMMAYHSMNTAAKALGVHTSNLNLQILRLEKDLGAPLLHRANNHRPMTLTDRGQRLLEQLDHPDVRQLLDHHTRQTPNFKPDHIGRTPHRGAVSTGSCRPRSPPER